MLQELVAVEGDSVGDTPESCFSEPELWLRSMWPPGGSVGQRVPCPGIANQMIALGFLLFSFFPSFLLFLHYPLQPGAPNLNKLQVASISCSVNLWKGLFFAVVQRAKKIFRGVRTKFLCRGVQSEGRRCFFAWLKKVLSYPKPHISVLPLFTYSTKCHLEKKKISYNVAAKLLPGECACWEPGAIWKQ